MCGLHLGAQLPATAGVVVAARRGVSCRSPLGSRGRARACLGRARQGNTVAHVRVKNRVSSGQLPEMEPTGSGSRARRGHIWRLPARSRESRYLCLCLYLCLFYSALRYRMGLPRACVYSGLCYLYAQHHKKPYVEMGRDVCEAMCRRAFPQGAARRAR